MVPRCRFTLKSRSLAARLNQRCAFFHHAPCDYRKVDSASAFINSVDAGVPVVALYRQLFAKAHATKPCKPRPTTRPSVSAACTLPMVRALTWARGTAFSAAIASLKPCEAADPTPGCVMAIAQVRRCAGARSSDGQFQQAVNLRIPAMQQRLVEVAKSAENQRVNLGTFDSIKMVGATSRSRICFKRCWTQHQQQARCAQISSRMACCVPSAICDERQQSATKRAMCAEWWRCWLMGCGMELVRWRLRLAGETIRSQNP